MTNPLLRAVQEYIDNESAYVRDVEGEIQVLHRQLEHTRVRALRYAIAALYWRAGDLFDRADETGVREFSPPPPDGYPLARVLRDEGCGVLFAARAMEAAL